MTQDIIILEFEPPLLSLQVFIRLWMGGHRAHYFTSKQMYVNTRRQPTQWTTRWPSFYDVVQSLETEEHLELYLIENEGKYD